MIEHPEQFGLTSIGRLATRSTRETPGTRFSIGCECLDRGMWELDAALPHLRQMGARWARVQTGWARCEKVKGAYDFAWLDKIVDGLLEAGLQPWFNMSYGNRHYTPDAPHETAPGWVPYFTEAARAGWQRFAAALARHFRDRVQYYEVWNEPDLHVWWTPGEPAGRDYADFVSLTAAAVRSAFPAARIVGGAVSEILKHHGMTYIEEAFDAGLGRHLDVFTYHSYAATPDGWYERQVEAMRAIVNRHCPGIPIWQGESGAPSTTQAGQALEHYEWDLHKQAKWTTRRTLLDVLLDVPLSSFFHASDFDFYIVKDKRVEKPYFYGLVNAEKQPKPAYFAYQSLCTLFAGPVQAAPGMDAQIESAANGDPPPPVQARVHSLDAEGRPLVVYWYPGDMMKAYPACAVDLQIWSATTSFLEPVLLDPISQQIYRPREVVRVDARTYRLKGIPLADWPLIIAPNGHLPLAGR